MTVNLKKVEDYRHLRWEKPIHHQKFNTARPNKRKQMPTSTGVKLLQSKGKLIE